MNLVSGSVRRSRHRLRVGVELVRANSGARLWGAEFDRPDTDLLDVEANVASARRELPSPAGWPRRSGVLWIRSDS